MNILPTFAGRGDLAPLLNRIHHCDALELLRRLPDASVGMVLCDLPYGVTACAWDEIIPLEPMWKALKRVAKQRAAIVLTATQPFTSKLVSSNYEMFRYEWIWLKDNGSNFLSVNKKPFSAHESVLVFGHVLPNYYPQFEGGQPYRAIAGKADRVGLSRPNVGDNTITINSGFRYPKSYQQFNYERGLHPTQKPVALFEYLIKTYTQEGETVLDMCVGSGTTAVAARNLGRNFICGDITQEYVEMARTRLQNSDPFQPTIFKDGTVQRSLFEELTA